MTLSKLRRREVLKVLAAVAGAELCPVPWSRLAWAQSPGKPPLAKAIRGLLRREGQLRQPIEIHVANAAAGATAVTRLRGVEVDRRKLTAGENTFLVYSDPVTAAQDVAVDVAVVGRSETATVTMRPVYRVFTYLLPHSHHDLGYTDLQPHIEERQMHNIELGIELARKTANYPEGARFVWNLEVLWGADLFMQRRSAAQKQAFVDAVRQGLVSLNGMYANELTGMCRPEELLQLFRYGTQLGRQCGVKVNTAMMSDVPGYTWGTITAMAQAGIRYFSMAPNPGDRIGRLRQVWDDKPFWHQSPSGREQVLVWTSSRSYPNAPADERMVEDHQQQLDRVKYKYSIDYLRWSGHGDNGLPDVDIPEFVKRWNAEYEWPKYAIASTNTAFVAFEAKHGRDIPRLKGDLTPYWEDGVGSSALETAINRNAADRISQAEALMAMQSPSAFNVAEFTNAWRNVLLYSEHTWGAAASVRSPLAEMTRGQWEIKRQFAVDAETESKALLAKAIGQRAGTDAAKIDVINTTSWQRTEVVRVSKALSAAGDRVTDDAGRTVPSQRLSTGELAFLAADVPAFGSRHYKVAAGAAHAPAKPATVRGNVLDNGVLRAPIDAQSGNVVELALHGRTGNLIDTSANEAANQYVYVKGKDFETLEKEFHGKSFTGPDVGSVESSGTAAITVEEHGPLVVTVRVESSAPGCNSLLRRVTLYAEADWLEMSNVVDKKTSPLDSYPYNSPLSSPFSHYGGKESLQFAFPFAVKNAAMHMDIPLAEMRPEVDQLPGGNRNWLPVGRWIDVANEREGVTWVTLDAPLVEIGELSANNPGSQSNPALWREKIAPTQKVYSWVMNNHWETNYRASQDGKVEFRYAMRAHGGYAPAAASRFAIGLSQPLLAAAAVSEACAHTLPEIEPADVLALTVKPADEGGAQIVRLFGASGADHKASLRWRDGKPRRVWRSDLTEQKIEPLHGPIDVAGWDLVTLRIESE